MENRTDSDSLLKRLFQPNEKLSKNERLGIGIGWIVLIIGGWELLHPPVLPSFIETIQAFGPLVTKQGIIGAWLGTMGLTLSAILFSAILALIISYLFVIPFFRPIASAVTKLRYLSIIGLIVVFMLLLHAPGKVRLASLMFGIIPYMVTSMLSVILSREEGDYHYARTMGYSRWEVMWHVVIREPASDMLEAVRQNLAIAFVMIITVESKIREGGGLGTLLYDVETRRAKYDEVFAIMLLVLATGILLDFLLLKINKSLFPHAFLKRKK